MRKEIKQSRAVKEQLRGERKETNERVDCFLRRENRLLEFDFGPRKILYRYYSVAGILRYNMVYGHTEIYGVIRVIVGT